jgi:hypothetical protein
MYPSAGGCDECVSLYLYRHPPKSYEEVERLRAAHTGELKSNKLRALKIVPLKELWKGTSFIFRHSFFKVLIEFQNCSDSGLKDSERVGHLPSIEARRHFAMININIVHLFVQII